MVAELSSSWPSMAMRSSSHRAKSFTTIDEEARKYDWSISLICNNDAISMRTLLTDKIPTMRGTWDRGVTRRVA